MESVDKLISVPWSRKNVSNNCLPQGTLIWKSTRCLSSLGLNPLLWLHLVVAQAARVIGTPTARLVLLQCDAPCLHGHGRPVVRHLGQDVHGLDGFAIAHGTDVVGGVL